MKPILFMLEISKPFVWKPGYFNGPYHSGRFKRVWWGWFAIACVRMDLYEYNMHLRSGATEWKNK